MQLHTVGSTVVVGLDQCRKFLQGLLPKEGSREIWIKFGHGNFYQAQWDEKGNLSGIETHLTDKTDTLSRVSKGRPIPNLLKHLEQRCQREEGGVFYVPTQPQKFPLADYVGITDDIGVEIDHLPIDEQKTLLSEFSEVTGLTFASTLTSGGASIHAHLKMDAHYPVEDMEYWRCLAVIAFQSDPVTPRLHQPMRLPGFFRKEKGAYQELFSLSDRRYSFPDLLSGFQKWFEHKGWPFPNEISHQWWVDVWQPLFAGSNLASPSLKAQQAQQFLLEGNAAYIARRKAECESKPTPKPVRAGDGKQLSDLIQECCDRASESDFPGVDWKGGSGHYRGQCPFHQGKTGNSAWLNNKTGGYRFHCSSCTGDEPRSSFEYWVARQDLGSIEQHHGLRGTAYVEAAKQFLALNGVEMPKTKPVKAQSNGHGDVARIDGTVAIVEQVECLESDDVESLKQDSIPDSPAKFHDRFESSLEEGLIFIECSFDKKGNPKPDIKTHVGDHLIALAYVDSPTQDDAQLYIEFQARKELRTLTIKRSDLAGEGTEIIKLLNEHSYYHSRKHKSLLLDYINKLGRDCDVNYTVANRTGWIQDSFVLPDRSFGNTMIRFQQVDKPVTPIFHEIGTLKDWQKNVAAMTIGNSRLTFSLGVSFSAPLNTILSVEAGGYHFYGPTSTGKTSSLWVAASVYGQEKQNVMPWRSTSNALEYKAAARNDLALLLDEIGQATAQDVAQSAYLLANGQGKARMRKDLTMRDNLKWNLTFLSTGEHTLASYLEKGGIQTKGGQENRMPSIPAIVKNGYGAFENCHGFQPAQFSFEIKRATQNYCGTPFTAFMQRLVSDREVEGFEALLLTRHSIIRQSLTREEDYNEVLERVADRMACVQLGLELAIEYEVIPHTIEQVRWAIKTIFHDWVEDRGGAVNFELKQTLEKIEYLFTTQEYSDRIFDLTRSETTFAQMARNLLAYKRGDQFYVPPSVFEKEFVGELNRKTLIQALLRKQWLLEGADGKFSQIKSISGKNQRVYVFDKFWAKPDLTSSPADGDR